MQTHIQLQKTPPMDRKISHTMTEAVRERWTERGGQRETDRERQTERDNNYRIAPISTLDCFSMQISNGRSRGVFNVSATVQQLCILTSGIIAHSFGSSRSTRWTAAGGIASTTASQVIFRGPSADVALINQFPSTRATDCTSTSKRTSRPALSACAVAGGEL